MHSDEVIWMALSVLTQSLDVQVRVIGSIPDEEAEQSDPTRNNAVLFLHLIETYQNAWWDEFCPECENFEQLIDLVQRMNSRCSKQDFRAGNDWQELRALAKRSLAEAGLESCPIPYKIDFNDYIEVVHEEDVPK